MADEDELKAINRALNKFPTLVEADVRSHRERQKILKRFAPFARAFAKIQLRDDHQVTVRSHERHVQKDANHPDGVTIVRQHLRRVFGSTMSLDDLRATYKNFERRNLKLPTPGRLAVPNADSYDEVIAVWTAYFEQHYNQSQSLTPNVVKALIGSESDFQAKPRNRLADGITQITPATLKILQDGHGEAKDFIFKGIRRVDLQDPSVAIPLAIRWLFRKRETARARLGREPSAEEIILEYKGLLKSKSKYKENALGKFRGLLRDLERDP